MQPQTLIVVPLGRNYNEDGTAVCRETLIRCQTATMVAEAGHWHADQAVLMCAPGREKSRSSGPTMATMMGECIAILDTDVSVIVNCDDITVWGTLAEMRWVVAEAKRRGYQNCLFIFVTARRHDVRVRRIARWFFPGENIKVVTSDDLPVPLWGEYLLAYPKLILARLGFERAAEKFRRQMARPTRQSKREH